MPGIFLLPVAEAEEANIKIPSYLDEGLDNAKLGDTTIDPGAFQMQPTTGPSPLLDMDSPNSIPDKKDSSSPAAKSKKAEMVIAPVPFYNPQLGVGLGFAVGELYHPDFAGDAPPWVSGIGGLYSQNGTWAVGALQKMNFDNDNWRVTVFMGYGDINYSYYGVGEAAGNLGLSIPINQRALGGLMQVLYQVLPDFYVGGRFLGAKTQVSIDGSSVDLSTLVPSQYIPSGFPDFEINEALTSLGPRLQYDTRDSEFYPTKGELIDFNADIYRKELGGDFNYESYQLAYNKYLTISGPHILAFRAYGQMVSGDAPFFALSSFGGDTDLRGYTSGRYRDRMMVAGQVEYRLQLTRRIGFVTFAGLGSVGGSLGDFGEALPSVGLGLRYRIAKENGLDMRFDAAWGKDSSAVYFGIGQAF